MAIEFNEENDGEILVVHLLGTLVKADYGPFVSEFERLHRLHGKLHVLFDMTGLQGWDAGAAWEELKFDVEHFADIERLAMIGDRKWEQGMAAFFKPFTKATTRYFDEDEAVAARRWLGES